MSTLRPKLHLWPQWQWHSNTAWPHQTGRASGSKAAPDVSEENKLVRIKFCKIVQPWRQIFYFEIRKVATSHYVWYSSVNIENSWAIITNYNLILSGIWNISAQRHTVDLLHPFSPLSHSVTGWHQSHSFIWWRLEDLISTIISTHFSRKQSQCRADDSDSHRRRHRFTWKQAEVISSACKLLGRARLCTWSFGPFQSVFGETCSPFIRSQLLIIWESHPWLWPAILCFCLSQTLSTVNDSCLGRHKPVSKSLASARLTFSWIHTWSMSLHTSHYHLPGDKGPFPFCACYVSREVWPVSQWISIPVSPALVC